MSPATTTVLIVAEAMHESAAADIEDLIAAVAGELTAVWPVTVQTAFLRPGQPYFQPVPGDS
jgi:hypothetical protein